MTVAKNGLFITFEGPEGAGKSTQIELLREYFEKRGKDCVVAREPGGTEIGEKLRDILKHHKGEEPLYAEAELLLFEASRAQLVRNLIIPSLKNDCVVICDRFYDSTAAYQGYARKMDLDFINELNSFASCGRSPDITILLDLPVEEGFRRTKTRQETLLKDDRIESEALDFHRAVRDGFLDIASREPERIKIVSALGEASEIHKKIIEEIDNAV
ncbi:MAG: dTMP kinase [Lentisphaerae bacterium GWF2_45_14]|nr:MAG: dTMP kinase [Lentisphaerae bacterium GWF2_45_14]